MENNIDTPKEAWDKFASTGDPRHYLLYKRLLSEDAAYKGE